MEILLQGEIHAEIVVIPEEITEMEVGTEVGTEVVVTLIIRKLSIKRV